MDVLLLAAACLLLAAAACKRSLEGQPVLTQKGGALGSACIPYNGERGVGTPNS